MVFLGSAWASGAKAQHTAFYPSIAVGARYTNNVNYAANDEFSDTVTFLRLSLPVSRQGPRNSLYFSYDPSLQRYDEADWFDHVAHDAHFDWQFASSPRTNFSFATDFSQMQDQGIAVVVLPDEVPDTDSTLTGRTDRTYWGASMHLTHALGARWNLGGGLDWLGRKHEVITEAGAPPPVGPELEDRTEYGGSINVSRNLTADSSLGAEFQARKFDLDSSPDERSNALRMIYGKQVGTKYDLQVAVGAARRRLAGTDAEDGDVEFDGTLDLSRMYRRVRVALNAAHRPSSGGHIAGTSTYSLLGLGAFSHNLRAWQWSVDSTYAYRDPSDEEQETIATAALAAYVERAIGNHLGVRLDGGYTAQTTDDSLVEDVSVGSAELSVVYYPRGHAPLSRGEQGGGKGGKKKQDGKEDEDEDGKKDGKRGGVR